MVSDPKKDGHLAPQENKRTFFPRLSDGCFSIRLAFLVSTFRDCKTNGNFFSTAFQFPCWDPSPKSNWNSQIHLVSCFLDVTIRTVPSFLLTGIATQTVLDLICALDASLIKSY